MLTTTKNHPQTVADCLAAESIYYSKKTYFSYSSMNMLLFSPTAYYAKYVLRMDEQDKLMSYLINGKVIHCLLLDIKSFNRQFIVSPDKMPSDNERRAIELLFFSNFDEVNDQFSSRKTMNDYQPELLEVLKEINLHQKLADDKVTKAAPIPKSGNTKRLEKLITDENMSYWEFLIRRGKDKKDIIDQATYDYCLAAVAIIKQAPHIRKLLGMDIDELDNVQVFNEEYMQADLANHSYGIKGFLDNVKIDHDKRIIYINDLKTTSKDLSGFKESMETYRYWLQAGTYILLVLTKFKHLIQIGYKFKFHFIVIDPKFQVYAFPVSEESISRWAKRTGEIFDRLDYHYNNRRFGLPYEFDLGLVSL
jgi:hypothetical protein